MKFQSKNIQIAFIAVVLVVIGGFFAYQSQQKVSVNHNRPGSSEIVSQAKAWPDKLLLDIKFGKESYTTRETFKGEYYMKYDGPAFDGAILYCSAKDKTNKNCAVVKGRVENVDFSVEGNNAPLKAVMSAYTIDEKLGRMPANSFKESGTYSFSIAVFDCFYVEKSLGADCGGQNLDPKLLADSVQPVKWATKDIQITAK